MAAVSPKNLFVIENDAQFSTKLAEAGNKLVVVDFYATWSPIASAQMTPCIREVLSPWDVSLCKVGRKVLTLEFLDLPKYFDGTLRRARAVQRCGPCKAIAPKFVELAARYPEADFFKVDVDKCQNTASTYNITAMPTFLFLKGGKKLEEFKGADPSKLENTIKKHYSIESAGGGSSGVHGYIDLLNHLNKQQTECLNESDDHTLSHCLTKGPQYLESDCDEQLIVSVAFQSNVKLHSLKIHGPPDNAPKTVKLFINQPGTMDFDKAERGEAVQTLELTADDVAEDAVIPLKFVRFQNVQNVTLFIQDNLGGEDVTRIDFLSFIGATVGSTNMGEFKRVAGKKGESH